jgi:endonuclease YncB( thermonuclease family)
MKSGKNRHGTRASRWIVTFALIGATAGLAASEDAIFQEIGIRLADLPSAAAGASIEPLSAPVQVVAPSTPAPAGMPTPAPAVPVKSAGPTPVAPDGALPDPLPLRTAWDAPAPLRASPESLSSKPASRDDSPPDAASPRPSIITLSGEARALEANAVEIQGIRILLSGIVPPSPDDVCLDGDGVALDCREWSRAALGLLVDGMTLSCDILASPGSRGRSGDCSLALADGATIDVAGWAASVGVARADGSDSSLASAEEEARAEGLGFWSARASSELDRGLLE